MASFNWLLTNLFTLLFWPFQGLAPLWALAVVSCVTGLGMLWVFGKVSNQAALKRVRERIRGRLLGVRLYQHDIRVVLKLQGEILRDTLLSCKYSVLPLLVLFVPMLLILVQLNLRFSLRPLEPGRPALVKVKFKESSGLEKNLELKAPEAIKIESPGVQIAAANEVAWRIRATSPGYYALKVGAEGEEVEKALWVGSGWGVVSAVRPGPLSQALFHPGEPPIMASQTVEAIEVTYRSMPLLLFGWNVPWLVVFLGLSMLSGFAFRRVLGVEV